MRDTELQILPPVIPESETQSRISGICDKRFLGGSLPDSLAKDFRVMLEACLRHDGWIDQLAGMRARSPCLDRPLSAERR